MNIFILFGCIVLVHSYSVLLNNNNNNPENSLESQCIRCLEERKVFFSVSKLTQNNLTFCYYAPIFLSSFAIITDFACSRSQCIGIDERRSLSTYDRYNFSCGSVQVYSRETSETTNHVILFSAIGTISDIAEVLFIAVALYLVYIRWADLRMVSWITEYRGIQKTKQKNMKALYKLKRMSPNKLDTTEETTYETKTGTEDEGRDVCGHSYSAPCTCDINPDECKLRYVHNI